MNEIKPLSKQPGILLPRACKHPGSPLAQPCACTCSLVVRESVQAPFPFGINGQAALAMTQHDREEDKRQSHEELLEDWDRML